MAYKRVSPQPVVEGGTGVQSATAYAVLTGGTTSTGALQSIASVGTSGQILTSNGAGALPTFQAPAGTTTLTYTAVNHAASPYTVLVSDDYLGADVTAGVISILLPNAPATGKVVIVKDKVGLAATSNITVTTVGGAVTLDGSTSFVMNTAYQSAEFIFNGASYEIF